MLLEAITDSDNFRLAIDLEIIAGDFDVTPELLNEIIDYCLKLGLLKTDSERSFLWSKTLDNRFEPLLTKRKRDRGEVIADDNTHSKVKESKGKDIEREKVFRILEPINLLLKRKGSNTMEIQSMVEQWVNEGHTDILPQLGAMKAVYQKQNLVFPTKITTLTQSFGECDWLAKLQELDPEKIAENVSKEQRNGKQRRNEPDTIGTSEPGSLG